jgi:HSP20 family molecular chaperone IbpA
MLYPIIHENLFDNLLNFQWPVFPDFSDVDRKLYGKHASRLMKTDVQEHENHYEVAIDLPGFKKDEITLDLENGYLTVSAAKGLDKEEQTQEGKMLRQERYAGEMQRSFYVGETITAEDVQAKLEDGVLTLTVPKKEAPKLPEKQTIMIAS